MEPPSIEMDGDTRYAVVHDFLFPDECPLCLAWEGRTDDEQCRLAAEEFADASPDQKAAMIEMVRQAGRDIRGCWMGQMLQWPTVEYENMTDEQKRIVDAGDEVAGLFPEGLTREQLAIHLKSSSSPCERLRLFRPRAALAHSLSTIVSRARFTLRA